MVDEVEPILQENPNRFCMFPIKYPQVWEMYKKAEASFWTGKRNPAIFQSLGLCWMARIIGWRGGV
jgi:hypothetical protein